MKELITWKDVIQALLDGERVEYLVIMFGRWEELTTLPSLHITDLLTTTPITRYRIKPRTIAVGDMEVPEPIRDASEFKQDEIYFVPSITNIELYAIFHWDEDNIDLRLFKRGLVHRSEEGAIFHAIALIKISGGSY